MTPWLLGRRRDRARGRGGRNNRLPGRGSPRAPPLAHSLSAFRPLALRPAAGRAGSPDSLHCRSLRTETRRRGTAAGRGARPPLGRGLPEAVWRVPRLRRPAAATLVLLPRRGVRARVSRRHHGTVQAGFWRSRNPPSSRQRHGREPSPDNSGFQTDTRRPPRTPGTRALNGRGALRVHPRQLGPG